MSGAPVDQLARVMARVEAARGARGDADARWGAAWDALPFGDRVALANLAGSLYAFGLGDARWSEIGEPMREHLQHAVRHLRGVVGKMPD